MPTRTHKTRKLYVHTENIQRTTSVLAVRPELDSCAACAGQSQIQFLHEQNANMHIGAATSQPVMDGKGLVSRSRADQKY